MPKFTFVVFSNPVEGREDEYNEWYDNTHVPDVLRVPGVLSAQRFRRTEQQRNPPPHPWQYLALYRCDAAEPNAVTEALAERYNTPEMLISDALGERYGVYFEPLTDEQLSTK